MKNYDKNSNGDRNEELKMIEELSKSGNTFGQMLMQLESMPDGQIGLIRAV